MKKPGKFLAHQLKKRKKRKIINKITEDGKEINEEKEIKKAFLKFYSKLYKEEKMAEGNIDDYMEKMDLKELTQEESNLLDGKITQEEIQKAIDQKKLGKAPGPDDYTTKFYKVFKN